jgi:CheY-like chemotaxis protein
MTKSQAHPFALRLIGYTEDERAELNRHFPVHNKLGGHAYHILHENNLQDPDLYLVNVDAPDALAALDRLRPAPLRPAMLVGAQPVDLPHAFLPAPVEPPRLLAALDQLVAQRAEAWARLDASDKVSVPERRRRLPTKLDESAYPLLRKQQREGGVLVVDGDGDFCQAISRIVSARRVRVDRANDHRTATLLCKQLDIALVFINTATPGLDPYRLCEAIKAPGEHPITVIFLIGRYFSYQAAWAQAAGCEGFVSKPLSERQLVSLLEKFLPRPVPAALAEEPGRGGMD